MSTIAVRVLWVVLAVLWASGLWAHRRRRRLLSENDYRQAEQWRTATEGVAPHGDPLLVSLDLALRDECYTGKGPATVVADPSTTASEGVESS
jgi:hypothetical protein